LFIIAETQTGIKKIKYVAINYLTTVDVREKVGEIHEG